jgi:phosphoribosyl 1,2-cyclic phosphodiesterase
MLGFDSSDTNSQPHSTKASQLAADQGFSAFTVRFWGVRGSIPTPGLETVRYGGNTACVELQVAGQRLIFDGGTGLRLLGRQLLNEMPVQAHLFFTHTQWDRIQGFPFFTPAFIEGNRFDIYGPTGQNGASIKQRLCEQMLRPNFPVPLQRMRSHLTFHDIAPGAAMKVDDVVVETIPLNHLNRALGYRITWNGRSVVYATDVERLSNSIGPRLLHLAQQADVLIYNAASAQHPPYHAPQRIGEQQSAIWYAGIEMAMAAKVKQVVLFHHDPSHEDDFLDHVEAEVKAYLPTVQLAREGMTLQVY